MSYSVTRRAMLAGLASASFVFPGSVWALNDVQARALIERVVNDINRVINSGKSERAMYGDFERIFRRYGDVANIARATLGADARRASSAQLRTFADAFGGYMSRKYGKRFREFIGGRIDVTGVRSIRDYFEVQTRTKLAGSAPFDVRFRVSDKSGKDLFFDIVIEGISLGKTERTEIGALLDRNRGDIDAMVRELKSLG